MIVEEKIPTSIQSQERLVCEENCVLAQLSLYKVTQLLKKDIQEILEEKKL